MRMVLEAESGVGVSVEAICRVAEKTGPTAETVRKWVRRHEIDYGKRPGLSSDERERLRSSSGRIASFVGRMRS